jgi:multidrug efflux pump subunit AcrB
LPSSSIALIVSWFVAVLFAPLLGVALILQIAER